MPTEDLFTLIAAVLAFVASVGAIIVTAYHGRFYRFASERWWLLKAEAYMRIIEALSDLVYYYQEISAAEYGEIELSEPKRLEIDEYWRRGNLAVRKATNVGSFLISAEAEEALKQYWRPPAEKHDPNDWIRELDHKFRAADICLKELVECAKRDLGVETTRLGRRRTPRA